MKCYYFPGASADDGDDENAQSDSDMLSLRVAGVRAETTVAVTRAALPEYCTGSVAGVLLRRQRRRRSR
eukprot:5241304-Pyramimonas_sp.AAC.1